MDEFLAEYDEITSDVTSSRHNFFADNLRRWFSLLDGTPQVARVVLQLEQGVDFKGWYEAGLKSVRGVGSGKLVWPQEREKRLGLHLLLFRGFANGSPRPSDFAMNFLYSGNNFNDMVHGITDQLFLPFSRELRRRFVSAAVRSDPTDAPASDRVVTLDHNSAAYREAIDALERAERSVEQTNDYEDAEDKEQRIAELSAGRRLLKSTRVRIAAALTVLGSVLLFLMKAFANSIIGQAAATAWKALAALFGQDWPDAT